LVILQGIYFYIFYLMKLLNFRHIRKIAKKLLSVYSCGITWLTLGDFHEIWLWVFFLNLSRKYKFYQNLTRIMGILREDLRMYIYGNTSLSSY
jgi:hypothetical protein